MKKKAIILGVTGQDGSYMAELLLKKNYSVHGIYRKSATSNTRNINNLERAYRNASNPAFKTMWLKKLYQLTGNNEKK